MINDLEGKSAKELREIVVIQQEEYQKLLADNVELEKHQTELRDQTAVYVAKIAELEKDNTMLEASATDRQYEVIGANKKLDELKQKLSALEKERQRILHAGSLLANCAYNLKQKAMLPDSSRMTLDECQERWDNLINQLRKEVK